MQVKWQSAKHHRVITAGLYIFIPLVLRDQVNDALLLEFLEEHLLYVEIPLALFRQCRNVRKKFVEEMFIS